jgi:hypothetical protein
MSISLRQTRRGSESVAGSHWNGWPDQIGIPGRIVPECACQGLRLVAASNRNASSAFFRCQSRLNQMAIQTIGRSIKNNDLGGGEGWTSDPSPPPLAHAKAFSRSGCGRIFSLFSRVMRERLSTGLSASGSEGVSHGRFSLDLLPTSFRCSACKYMPNNSFYEYWFGLDLSGVCFF